MSHFPDGGTKTRVSREGGAFAQWSPDGRALFFASHDIGTTTKMFAVEVRTTPTLSVGSPRVLFESRFVDGLDIGRTWAVSYDGKRFLLLRGERTLGRSSELVVVQNWLEEVRQLSPAK